VLLTGVIAEFNPLPESVSQRIVTVGFRPVETGGPVQRSEALDSLIPRLAAHPEVVAVVPEPRAFEAWQFRAADAPADTVREMIHIEGTTPGYFALLDVPILLGRDVALADTAGREYPVVIGNDLARRVWNDASPIGRTLIRPSRAGDTLTLVVVGVYDATHATTRGGKTTRVYTAHGKRWNRTLIHVRTRGAADPFLPALRQFIRTEAPGLPVTRMETRDVVDRNERLVTLKLSALVGAGGALALLLASLGLYGVVSLAVQQRRREIGIRIAVGATPQRVALMFLSSGVRVGALGLVIGLPLCIVGLAVVLRQDFIIAPEINPWAIGVAIAAILLAVASGATWIPARRAARVDPATTLRVE
jgi:putative ABC transport system permease protein